MLTALPILLWTVSGLLYPFMGGMHHHEMQTTQPDSSKIKISLRDALEQQHIADVRNSRIVQFNGAAYYQVQHTRTDTLTYIHCGTGKILAGGDKRYALFLARHFTMPAGAGHNMDLPMPAIAGINIELGMHCEAPNPNSRFAGAELVRAYGGEYRAHNKLLPVYRVSFEGKEPMRCYVQTSTDRLAATITDGKARFDRFFSFAHSWSFLDGAGPLKPIALGSFAALCLFSCISGFYIYNILKLNKRRKGAVLHRRLGNALALTTAVFAFSGAWHAFQGLNKNKGQGPLAASERFSFSNLHMQHYWEGWLGNELGGAVRNMIFFFSTAGLLLLAITGLLLYVRRKRKSGRR